MTTSAENPPPPVRRTVRVLVTAERAFHVFTHEFDSWWPRGHHIGTSPLKRAVIEARAGGRCYSEQVDGTECPWGTVLTWNPPRSFSFAWQINADWTFQSDLARSSEVEVTFKQLSDGSTEVVLEHRHFERHGAGATPMHEAVSAEGGWGSLLGLYSSVVDGSAPAASSAP